MKKIFFLATMLLLLGCSKTEEDIIYDPIGQLQLKLNFDETQIRLDNFGAPSTIPSGHAAQTPSFRGMSIHQIELVPNASTPVGAGEIIYQGTEKVLNGQAAIDFDQAIVTDENVIFQTISYQDIAQQTYEFIRVSVAYQSYDLQFNLNNVPIVGNLVNQKGRMASFLGFNTYLSTVNVREKDLTVNGTRRQGFWVFETQLSEPYDQNDVLLSGMAPEGATTVVNPLAGISDIPAGSCLVTGKFAEPLTIDVSKVNDTELTLSFSVNQSIEWEDTNNNGALDFDVMTPANNEQVVDMGLRGLIPSWQ